MSIDPVLAFVLSFVIGAIWMMTLWVNGFWAASPMLVAIMGVFLLTEGIPERLGLRDSRSRGRSRGPRR